MSTQHTAAGCFGSPAKLQPFKNKSKSSKSGTAEPGEELLQVVIETPRGSRNKYSFADVDQLFRLKAALPAGMVFPYDFGFVPSTVGGDGDPLDVLVLMDEPAFPGAVLLARLLGVMLVEQTQDGKTERNDRFLAVAETSHLYSSFKAIDDLSPHTRMEIEHFFSNYHKLQGKESHALAWQAAADARKLIDAGSAKAGRRR